MVYKGQIIQDRYKVVDYIGAGGIAQVYLVYDLHLDKKWAMKSTDLSLNIDIYNQTFEVEKNFMRCMNHPVFPTLIDSFTEKEMGCLVMEYIQGENLEEYLKRKKNMNLTEAVTIICEIMDALAYLHKQTPVIIYGDLKPSNIMIQPNMRIRILDFGAASWGEQKYILGTPEYASPEQISEHISQIDERSDIYTIGLIFAEMVTGKKAGGDYWENPLLPKWSRSFISKCTRLNPEERFQTMEQAMKGLNEKNNYGKRSRKIIIQDMERIFLSECDLRINK